MAYELVAIGGSWGGARAVHDLLARLPAALLAPIVVALHRSPSSPRDALTSMLGAGTGLVVCEADDKDPLVPGRVHVAPPDYHLLVEPGGLALSIDERVQYSRPSIDVLFESAADAYAQRTIGVLLTGANADGAAGLARIRARGGLALVQDPTSAARGAMPTAAIAAGAADEVLALEGIAARLAELCGSGPRADLRN